MYEIIRILLALLHDVFRTVLFSGTLGLDGCFYVGAAGLLAVL